MDEGLFGSDQLDEAADHPMSFSSMPELEGPLQSPKEERPYKCNQCDKTYRHAGSLVNHKKTHQIGLYTCLICQKEYSNPMGLKNHLRIHSEEKRFRCSECGLCFRMARQLSSHRKEVHAFYCVTNGENVPGSQESMDSAAPVLAENSSLISNIENYIAESMVPGDFSQLISKYYPDVKGAVEYEASHDEELETATELKDVHVADSSSEERRYKCKQCGKAYKHAGSLANHKQSHKVGVYQCVVCFKEFSNLMAMKNHCRLHSDSRNSRLLKSPCSIATLVEHATVNNAALVAPQPAIFNAQEKCDEQLAMLDGSEGSISDEETLKTPPDRLCSLQDPMLLSPSGMTNGQQTGIDTSIDLGLQGSCKDSTVYDMSAAGLTHSFRPEDKVGQGQSEQPGPEGTDEEEAKAGENLESRPFKCQLCEKSYRHAGSLINHKKTHQTGVYSCSVCSKQLFNMAALKNHVRAHFKSRAGRRLEDGYYEPVSFSDELFHRTEELYKCEVCNEILSCKRDFLQHQMFHQQEFMKDGCNDVPKTGIYQCSFCPKEYPDLLSLRNHFVSHTKLQVLRNGNREASDGSDDREHVGSLPSFDNRYDCGHCGMIFSNEADFHQHQVAHENQVISSLPGNPTDDEQIQEFTFPMHTSEQELLRSINNEMEGGESTEVSDGGPHLSHICGFCGKTYDDLASLEAHSLSHADEAPPADKSPVHAEVDLEDTNVQANTDIKQEEEENTPAEPPNNDESQERRPYTCDKCGKSYRHGGSLVNHKKTHLVGNFKCFVCSRQYPNLAAFRNHLRHHPKCKTGASYSNIQELQPQSPHDNNGEIPNSSSASSVPLPDPYSSQENSNECFNPLLSNLGLQSHGSVHLPFQTHKTRYKSLSRPAGVRSSRKSGRRRRLVASRSLEEAAQNTAKRDSQNASEASDKPVQICPFCDKVFLFVDELLKHQSDSCDSAKCNKETRPANTVDQVDIKETPPLSLDRFGQKGEAEEASQQRPFRCEVCGRSYRHAGSLINHKQTHKTGIFRCAICQKPFFNLMAMKNHNRIHFELKRHKCVDCGKAFRLRKQLETHQRIHKEKASAKRPGRRNRRVARSRRGSALQKSLSDGVPASNVRKESSVKDKEGRDQIGLGASVKRDPDARPYQCKDCGRSYRHAGSLFNHKKSHTMGHYCCSVCEPFRTHTAEKRFQCLECGKAFRSSRELICHHRVHTGERPFHCPTCNRGFSSKLTLRHHQRSHTTSLTTQTVPSSLDVPTEGTETCEEDPSGSAEDASKLGSSNSQEERRFKCNQCDRSYRHAGSLLNHRKTHSTGVYQCPDCHKEFFNLLALKNHLRIHRYPCPDCGKAFRIASHLATHRKIHEQGGPFTCQLCSKRFFCRSTFEQHQLTHSSQDTDLLEPQPMGNLMVEVT
uniref:Zinc finger protein 646 n=1 Tax=Xenopus tropicalis TaxID=8364 RepID=A0A1B8XWY3_XENTR